MRKIATTQQKGIDMLDIKGRASCAHWIMEISHAFYREHRLTSVPWLRGMANTARCRSVVSHDRMLNIRTFMRRDRK